MTLRDAARHPLCRQGRESGRPVNRNTVIRWATAGLRGPGGSFIVLQTRKIGGIRLTSLEALERFLAAINGEAPRTPAQVRRDHARAERDLDVAGV